MFSSEDSYVDFAQQGVFNNSIDEARGLASQRYGNHNDYFILDCSAPGNQNEPGCQEGFDPAESGLYAGEEGDVMEFEAFNPEDVDELCENNPKDPLCYAQPIEGGGPGEGDAFGPPPEGGFAPGTQPASCLLYTSPSPRD